MAALRCSKCGARIELDGTSSCSCAGAGRGDVSAFQAFRPRLRPASSRRLEAGTDGPAPGNGRRPVERRGKGLAMGVATAVALGTVAFSVGAMSSGSSVQGAGRPAVSVSPDPDIVAREAAERSDQDVPGEPRPGDAMPSADDGMRPAGEEGARHPGSQPPASHDGMPAPPPSGDVAGGSTGGPGDGGDEGDNGGDGGASNAGGSQGGGDGDHDEGNGGLLSRLLGFLLGGDHHGDGGHGKDKDRGGSDHRGRGGGPHGGGPH